MILINQDDDKQQFETLFQISIEKPISYDYFGLNETVSTIYSKNHFGKQENTLSI